MGKAKTDYGALVFPHIPVAAHADAWISNADLATFAGLTKRNARYGIAQLRRTALGEALVSSPQGYRFTVSESEVDAFRIRQCRAAVALVETVWVGAVQPLLCHMPNPVRQREITRTFTRALEDMGDLLDHAS